MKVSDLIEVASTYSGFCLGVLVVTVRIILLNRVTRWLNVTPYNFKIDTVGVRKFVTKGTKSAHP